MKFNFVALRQLNYGNMPEQIFNRTISDAPSPTYIKHKMGGIFDQVIEFYYSISISRNFKTI
jgi:hypothetical protein